MGYSSYLKAAVQIINARDDVTFFAIGGGPNFEHIKNLISSEYSDRFILTGPLVDVESVINIFDIGVLSTNTDVHGEGISNSLMECMALGKPVIATEGGGTNELIIENKTGFLIPPKSPDIMAIKIRHLLERTNKSSLMGKSARQHIIDNFELSKMTEKYFNLYEKLLIRH